MDKKHLSETGETGLIILSGIVFMFFMVLVLLLFFYFSKKKVIKKELETQQLKFEHQKALLQASILIQEQERERIARELHDDISSKLNIISLNSHLLAERNLPEGDLIEIAQNNVGLVATALETSRHIAHDLLPPVLDKFGLDAALQSLCNEISNTKHIRVEYNNTVQFDDAQKHRYLHVFRIIQELISNSIKHGKASFITISIVQNNGKTKCDYTDNGQGFDMAKLKTDGGGIGMKNIESRIVFLDGTFKIESDTGKGIHATFSF